ncbi:MAG: hypothetical protein ABL921_21300 [Pirellula sp.]
MMNAIFALTRPQIRNVLKHSMVSLAVAWPAGMLFSQEPSPADISTLPKPVEMTAQEDHRHMMNQLGITSIRRGARRDIRVGAKLRVWRWHTMLDLQSRL